VAATVKVYDVSGEEPAYLYNFGTYGIAEGEMNYPIDICLDGSGLVYVADGGNNRVQVWSY
jgi:tripartite motif-containing protein 2/3/tripartite motif-containing protein 71